MRAYERAFRYLVRKKRKSVLLLVILFLMMTLVLTGMSVRRASEAAAADLREELGGYFKLAPNYEKRDVEQLVDEDLIRRVMEVGGIKAYNGMNEHYLTVPDLMLMPGRFTAEQDSRAQMAHFFGNTDSQLHEYFVLDFLALKEGSPIRQSDRGKALISSELASLNELKPGDVFSVRITEDGTPEAPTLGDDLQLEVAGIFERVNLEEGDSTTQEWSLPANFIFIDTASSQEIAERMRGEEADYYQEGATFFVQDPKNQADIINKVTQMEGMDWESLKLTENNRAYRESMEPLTRLGAMTLLMVLLIVAVSVLLLTLLLALWERDRIHEAGVLLSFGISKGNILWQHLIECAAVFLLAFCLAAAVSVPLSGKIGGLLYGNARTEAEEEEERPQFTFADDPILAGMEAEETSFVIAGQPLAFALSGLLGIGIVGLSVGGAFLVTARRKPRELFTIME